MEIKLVETNDSITEKSIEIAKKMLIEKNLRYYGSAATCLKNQLTDPKYKDYKLNSKLINIGIDGEKETSKLLREWIEDKKECVLFDSISLPIKEKLEIEDNDGELDLGDTDHAIIIGNNLVLIDSKNWKAKTSYQINEEDFTEILRVKKQFQGNKPRVHQNIKLWENYLKDFNIENIYYYVCISNKESFVLRDRNWWRARFKLVTHETLIYFLDKMYNEKIEDSNKNLIRLEFFIMISRGLTKPFDAIKDNEELGKYYKLAMRGS